MAYFEQEKYVDETSTESLLNELGDICLEELMLSSDAYVCMMKLNMQGYKRLHRYLSKEFQDLYLELQRETFEKYYKMQPSKINYETYKADNIKTHLENWNEIMEKHLKRIGEIIKMIFENDGYIPCVASKIQKILYRNIVKNTRALQKFADCDWSYEIIYKHDYYLHEKMKKEEHEKYGYTD